MKKNLKKSLSLFLAVLMLMSCWVWVAPQKAEAGTATQYYVKIVSNVTDTGNENSSQLIINYKDTNGKGDSGRKVVDFGQMSWDGSSTIFSGPIDGWPVSFTWTWNIGAGRAEKHENITFYVGGTEDTCTTQLWKDNYNFKNALVGTDYLNLSATLSTSYNPTFKEISDLSTTDVAVSKLKDGADVTSDIKVTGGKDQYGVNWAATIPTLSGVSYKLKYTNAAGTETDLGSTYGTISGTSNTATATFKDDVQTLFPNSANAKVYVHATYNSKTKSVPINLTFPTYDITFDANGGKIGATGSDAKDTVVTSGIKYGGVIGKSPAHREKAGFEFKGFYSVKNADATGLEASFTGTKYVDSETKVDTHGDCTWYAAWQALPITATFVTQDGQLIGTVEGRYNNSLTASNMHNGLDGLNAKVKASHTAGKVQFNGNEPIFKDGNQALVFAGWKIIEAYDESVMDGNENTVLKGNVTFQAVYRKADATKYTVSFEDGAGNVTSSKSDYLYRAQVTGVPSSATKAQDDKYTYEFIGWAKKLAGVNYFAVDENDCDADGIKLSYTSKDAAEFIVKGDATYVPVFRMTARKYNVTYNYIVDGGASVSTVIEGYHWDDTPSMPEIKDNYTAGGYRYYIDGWKVGTDNAKKQLKDIKVNGDLVLTATYGAGIGAEYTINFYGKAVDGVTDVLLNEDSNIYTHNATVTVPTAPTVPQTIDTEEALYTFAGWSPAVNTTASGDADYYATYTKQTYADIHFYNYDGTLLSETAGKGNGLFVGDVIPVSVYSGETPVKEEDPTGTYVFTGWVDSQGNEVVPGTDKFEGDTYLYAQFDTVYKEYTVKFLNDDGSVISEKTYHYATEIEIPANPTKAEDVQYKYEFKSWTPDVSKVCYGDATYTATYRRDYQTYDITWFKDNKSDKFSEAKYRYDQTIHQAVMKEPVTYPEASEGNTWTLKHWVQCDEDGNDILVNGEQVIFVRGRKMTAEHLYFYPVFEEKANIITVTFYKEDGTTYLGTAEIPYGGSLADYDAEFKLMAPKAPDATNHYTIKNWKDVTSGEDVETASPESENKLSVKAAYSEEAHDKKLYELVAAPTCNVPGFANYKCEADECTLVDYNRVIAPITDNGAPTGQILVGTDKWTLDDYNGIDYTEEFFIGPKTTLIVNANDLGTHNWSLEDGEYETTTDAAIRGVGKIEYYVSSVGKIDPATVKDIDWTEIYNYEALRQEVLTAVLEEKDKTLIDYTSYIPSSVEKAEIDRTVDAYLSVYKANATGIVSNLNLENGKCYVIYIKVSDREGNDEVNTSIFSTGTLKYGNEAAEIEVTGEGYGSKFCEEANIRIIDDASDLKSITIDGEEVTAYTNPGTTSANGTFVATFKTTEKGIHTVEVIDKNGNKTVKTFEIKGDHTYRNYTIAATCETAGSKYDLCTVCGHKDKEEAISALGHNFKNYVDKAPDCLNDGYRTYVCDNNCGTKLVVSFDKDTNNWTNLEAANLTVDDIAYLKSQGKHTYAKVQDENGEDTTEDAWVIDKAPTCKVPGSKHKDCTICGALGRVTEPIDADLDNGHKFYREKVTTPPTCTTQGEKTKTCRYCGKVVFVEYVDALGHTDGEYRVITPATCETKGSQIRTCAVCGVDMGTAVEIPALGHAYSIDGSTYEEDGKWYQNYKCSRCGEIDKREVEAPPAKVSVTFDFNGGHYTIPAVGNPNEIGYVPEKLKGTQTLSKFVGESISADEVEKAFKLENATYTYTFSHWEDADGKVAKFPIEVKADATYKAVYAEKYINYTITYYKEDGKTEFKKTGYLHNGQEVNLDKNGPAKAETNLAEYVFAGWENINDATADYSDYKATINGANINLKAKYTEKKKVYGVTYAYSSNNQLESFNVDAGTAARDCAIIPEKASDTKYHYEFKGWNKADQLANVVSNIYTTPDFTAIDHTYTHQGGKMLKSKATCTSKAVYTYTCTCGYTYDKEEGSALEHIWGTPEYNEETGKNVVTCTREGCGYSEADTRTFTAKFYVNAGDTTALKNVSYIPWGTVIDSSKLPAAPSKESTTTTYYTFKGWAVKGDETNAIVDFTTYVIKEDCKFVAVFEATTKLYNVVFAYDATRVIKTFQDVPAGSSVTYSGIIPVQEYDVNYHYTFSNWRGYDKDDGLAITVSNIQSDVYITAEFSKAKHSFTSTELSQATCTSGAGIRYQCTCGYNYDITGKPLEHSYPADYVYENGEYVRYCEYGCGAKDVKEQPGDSGDNGGNTGDNGGNSGSTETKKHVLTVYVYENGNRNKPIANATVDIYKVDTTNKVSVWYAKEKTGTDGKVQFVVENGTYAIDISDIPYQKFYRDENVSVTGDKSVDASITVKACTCACHSTSLWGSIFRFFHKIIKLFTGEFKCCADPSNY